MRHVMMDPICVNRLGEVGRGWFPEPPLVFDAAGTAFVIDSDRDEPVCSREYGPTLAYFVESQTPDPRGLWFAHTPRSRVADQWQILELRDPEDAIPSVEHVAPSAEDVAGRVKDIVRGLDMDAEFSPLRTHTVPEDGRSITFTVMKIILPETSYGKEAIARVYEALGEGLTEAEGEALSTWVIPGE